MHQPFRYPPQALITYSSLLTCLPEHQIVAKNSSVHVLLATFTELHDVAGQFLWMDNVLV